MIAKGATESYSIVTSFAIPNSNLSFFFLKKWKGHGIWRRRRRVTLERRYCIKVSIDLRYSVAEEKRTTEEEEDDDDIMGDGGWNRRRRSVERKPVKAERSGVIKRAVSEARIEEAMATVTVTAFFDFKGSARSVCLRNTRRRLVASL